jgi:Tol biopolymer transport system component/imidazolonepropionase-like amidohydrolase
MKSRASELVLLPLVAAVFLLLVFVPLPAQEIPPTVTAVHDSSTSELPLKPSRTIEFDTEEGTWMTVDVSPDGKWIVFDLLGDIYLLPISGGEARALTRGMAWDAQPRFSPDGRSIVFISDRGGNDNIWIMQADGRNPRPVTKETKFNLGSPEWTADGQYIIARKYGEYPLESYLRKIQLWIYHRDGGSGLQLTKDERANITSGASVSPDGRYVYFSGHTGRFQYNVNIGRFQVHRFDRDTGEVETLTARYGGGLRPLLSPDGRLLVYASRHDAKTGLRLRDLETREERWLAYPIERDDQEGFTANDVLPGYGFTPDGKAVVLAYGGKIHRIDVETGEDSVIPFKARVELELGPFVYEQLPVPDGELRVRQMRWPNQSPDGKKLVFSAVGKIWVVDLLAEGRTGTPRRLTQSDDFEYTPRFSPDGKTVAYVSWSDEEGGHIWTVPARGGRPKRLTQQPAFYINPSWSPDGKRLVFDMGSAQAWLRREGGDVHELRWISSAGGPTHPIIHVRGSRLRPFFNGDGTRVFYTQPEKPAKPNGQGRTSLNSVRLDGVDRRTHLYFEGGADVVPSPDGRWLLFQQRDNVYLAPFPKLAKEPPTLKLKNSVVPVKQITTEGGLYPIWADGGRTLTWGFTDDFYRIPLDSVAAKLYQPKKEKKNQQNQEEGESKEEPPELNPETFEIELTVPRPKPVGKIALTGGRILTMRGDEVIERGDVVIDGNRIVAVGASGQVAIPPDAKVVDVSGKTILPGFIDTHAHLRPQPDVFPKRVPSYAANLAYGVTTSRDPSSSSQQVFAAAEMVESGDLLGPRVFSTGTAMYTLAVRFNSLKDARHHVRRYKRHGATYLKQYMQLRRIQRQWVIMAAKEVGINVTAEGGGDLKTDLSMVLDGYTGFEHNIPMAPLYDDVIQLLARAKTYYTPTLVVSYGGQFGQYYWRQKMDIHADQKLRRFTRHSEIDRKGRRRPLLLEDEYHFPLVAKGAADVLAAGGNVALGSHGEQQGIGAHWELWMLASGGMTPMQALQTATIRGAECLGMQQDLGSVESGKLADLIVLNSNPLQDLKNSLDIRYVMKNGVLFDGETLDQILPEKKPFGRFPWQEEDEALMKLFKR